MAKYAYQIKDSIKIKRFLQTTHSSDGKDIEDVSEYLDPNSSQYARMVEWIRRELGATTLKYQTIDDRIQGLGLPPKKLRLHCWLGK